MSANEVEIIASMPKSFSAHTACSREDPHPKLSLVNIMLPLEYGLIFKTNLEFIFLFFVVLKSPGSVYLRESKRNGPKPDFLIYFKYCLGIIASVSMLD